MFRLRSFNFLYMIPVACLLFSVRAFAQFEVAPDHFDSSPSQPVHQKAAKKKAGVTVPKTPSAARPGARMNAAVIGRKNNSAHHVRNTALPVRPKQVAAQASDAQVAGSGKSGATSNLARKPAEIGPSAYQRE